jgi:hypothetical protein
MHNSEQVLKLIRLLSKVLTLVISVLAALVHLVKDHLASIQLREVVALSQAASLIQKKDLNKMLEDSLLDDWSKFIFQSNIYLWIIFGNDFS